MTSASKQIVHDLYERFYANRIQQREREICIRCGKPRVLGRRGTAKLKCKKCRREG